MPLEIMNRIFKGHHGAPSFQTPADIRLSKPGSAIPKEISGNEGELRALTTKEVAHILGIHQNTVRRWSDLGIIKSFRISARGDRRFKHEDIYRFLNKINTAGAER